MNQHEAGFCQACRALVAISPLGGIVDHGDGCQGRYHRPATLTFGADWISWTVAANSYARSVLISPIDPATLEFLQRVQHEN